MKLKYVLYLGMNNPPPPPPSIQGSPLYKELPGILIQSPYHHRVCSNGNILCFLGISQELKGVFHLGQKNICLFPICCLFNQWVGRIFFLFY